MHASKTRMTMGTIAFNNKQHRGVVRTTTTTTTSTSSKEEAGYEK
jgi:hypothetical protein